MSRHQGAQRHRFADRKVDLYETPPCATRALMRVEPLPLRICDPCAGLGAMSRILIAGGHEVYATDLRKHRGRDPYIIGGVDFLRDWVPPDGFRTLVVNPPYMLADEFIRHALRLVDTVYVLQRFMALEGVKRSDLIDRHLRRVWLGRERLPMVHRNGWKGPRVKDSGMPFSWMVFKRRRRPASSGFVVRRMSWREEVQ